MNISKIIANIPINNFNYDYNNHITNYGLKITPTLSHDCVSFGATPKFNSKKGGVPLATSRQISKEGTKLIKKVDHLLDDLFGDLLVSDKKTNNLIYRISTRVKTDKSIKEKDNTRQFGSKETIKKEMTDLFGGKIELRIDSKEEVYSMLSRIIPAIRSHVIELLEIENKRPIIVKGLPENKACKYDYGPITIMEKLSEVQKEAWQKNNNRCSKEVKLNLYDDFTDANYCAIHMLFKILGKDPIIFELQIMGKDVAAAKKIDDLIWKLLNGKDIPKHYKPIKELLKPYAKTNQEAERIKQEILIENPDINPDTITLKTIFQKTKDEEFKKDLKKLIQLNEYRGNVFLFQRTKEPVEYSKKEAKIRFLPISSDLDHRLDFNELQDLILKCERLAAKNS